MISDALAEAVEQMDEYLDSDDWRGFYGSEDDPLVLALRVLRCLMDAMRQRLDTSPLDLIRKAGQ